MPDTEKIAARDTEKIDAADKKENVVRDTERIAMRHTGERTIQDADRISRMDAETYPMQMEINGCRVVMHFLPRPSEGVMERMQSILSNAYEERVQNNLRELVSPKVS